MKQINLFGKEPNHGEDEKYSKKIQAPVYEPKNRKPNLIELCDKYKTQRLINEIKCSNLPEDEKNFLLDAAARHSVFNYEKIADYYAHSSKEMQHFMERSALVIIDFEKAIELGYVRLCDEIRGQFLQSDGE